MFRIPELCLAPLLVPWPPDSNCSFTETICTDTVKQFIVNRDLSMCVRSFSKLQPKRVHRGREGDRRGGRGREGDRGGVEGDRAGVEGGREIEGGMEEGGRSRGGGGREGDRGGVEEGGRSRGGWRREGDRGGVEGGHKIVSATYCVK